MWKLAWRQLLRNRARSIITGTAIALAVLLFLMSLALGDGMYGKMMDAAERSAGGGVLIHAEGWWKTRESTRVLLDPAPVAAAAKGAPGVRALSERVVFEAVLTSAANEGFAAATLKGVDPEAEKPFNDLSRFLVKGTYLAGDDARTIVLGKKLTEDLSVDLGDRIVVRFTDAKGEESQALFRLGGVVATGSADIDRTVALVRLKTAMDVTHTDGGVTQIGVLGAKGLALDQLKGSLQRALGDRTQGLELLTWREAMPELVGFIEMDGNMNILFALIIFVVVAFGIANTFLMSVMERVRELGLLSALGVTPRRVGGLVLRETMLLALFAMGLGYALALAAHGYLSTHGLDYAQFIGNDFDVSGVIMDDLVIYTQINAPRWIFTGIAVFAMIVLSALYPAWRATRLDPSQAMRTYE
ncbi:MAG: ABC transporter permease [Deltaproteobacteria bacterium]|nr:MAG: ABC transporter permease [Deltaproteobacteria bacterium]